MPWQKSSSVSFAPTPFFCPFLSFRILEHNKPFKSRSAQWSHFSAHESPAQHVPLAEQRHCWWKMQICLDQFDVTILAGKVNSLLAEKVKTLWISNSTPNYVFKLYIQGKLHKRNIDFLHIKSNESVYWMPHQFEYRWQMLFLNFSTYLSMNSNLSQWDHLYWFKITWTVY